MGDLLKWFLRRFDTFLVRTVMPQSIFLVQFLLFAYWFGYIDTVWCFIIEVGEIFSEHKLYYSLLLVFLLLGTGYLFSIIQQLLDNRLKENFSKHSSPSDEIGLLRERVKGKLERQMSDFKGCVPVELTDYLLYQILESDIIGLKVNTASHNDQVKIIFITGIGLVLNVWLTTLLIGWPFLGVLCSAIGSIIILIATFNMAKARYRARNVRLYLNYLLNKKRMKNECYRRK